VKNGDYEENSYFVEFENESNKRIKIHKKQLQNLFKNILD